MHQIFGVFRMMGRFNKEMKTPLTKQQAAMTKVIEEAENNRALRDYVVPSVNGITSSIRWSTIQMHNFEINPAIIQMIQHSTQFNGLPNDDPNTHITNFLEIRDTFKHNGVLDEAIRLRFFSFSLKDKAKSWLNSLPSDIITTLDGLG